MKGMKNKRGGKIRDGMTELTKFFKEEGKGSFNRGK
jgi:hypothetical protein